MLASIGQISLYLALLAACIQCTLPLMGYYRHNPYLLAAARPAALAQFGFVLIAYVLLTIAFVSNDFTLAYVAENSHPALPLMYRLTAVWGAHEGSILLWVLMLCSWTVVYTFVDQSKLRAVTLSMLGIISLAFLTFLLFASNPFLPAEYAATGRDLNPLLQDIGFIIHPPMLYAGYVGFSVVFAITQAALLTRQLNQHWADVTRRFALAAWCFLTIGIMLGSWWAYRVLGWGGFWFWDPVENASLLPWLAGTALIHVLVVVEKRDTAKQWAAVLALITFSLSLLGTFLVRSGVIISVHSFASDPTRGVFLLLILAIFLSASLALFMFRNQDKTAAITYTRLSREMALLINSGILMLAMVTILIGTLYPLILDALQLGMISVGAPYFNTVMLPIVLLTLAMMGLAMLSHWQKQSAQALWQSAWRKLLFSFIITLIFIYAFTKQLDIPVIVGVTLSLWVITIATPFVKTLPGMSIAHFGFAIFIIGVILTTYFNQEQQVQLKPGNAANLGPYQFFFIKETGIQGPNYKSIRGSFEVLKNDRHVTFLYPEKRIYIVRDMVMSKVAIHPGIFRDLYIAMGEPLDQTTWSIRLYYKPFIRWVWAGGILMLIGGIFAILQRKSMPRLGHPLRQ